MEYCPRYAAGLRTAAGPRCLPSLLFKKIKNKKASLYFLCLSPVAHAFHEGWALPEKMGKIFTLSSARFPFNKSGTFNKRIPTTLTK